MAFNAKVRMALRDAVKEAHPEPEPGGGEMAYTAPPQEADPDAPAARRRQVRRSSPTWSTPAPPTVLRDLFLVKRAGAGVAVEEVQPALDLIRNHFRGAAMSHGALTGASHKTIAAALNELGGFSNTGEGGEARCRNDVPERAWGPFWEKVAGRARRAPGRSTRSTATLAQEPVPQPHPPGGVAAGSAWTPSTSSTPTSFRSRWPRGRSPARAASSWARR